MRKNIIISSLVIIVFSLINVASISALEYQSNTGVEFTINPTISINVSGDLIINDLTPGNSSDSNIITVTTSSNAIAGYGLYSTVGNNSNPSTELRKDGTDTTNKFASITANKTALSDFSNNDWGYSYSTDSGATWISGNTGSTSTGYNGLPLYTNTGIKLVDTTTSGTTTISFKIGAKASNSQIAGDYTNTINFIGVAKPNPPTLYETIAAMSKGTQTIDQLRAAITVPTSANRSEDTSNSGVYEYDASTYGVSSDAANTHKIYYYRGVLENNPGSYGSDGSAVTYPNYVKLTNNTCWRIVRTTGSGGIKMIYNGIYGATTSGSCANTQTNAQVTNRAFGLQGNSAQSTYWLRNINRVGYTFNNDPGIQDISTETSVDTVFGSDSDPTLNNARSNIKTYIEDAWYANNMTSYTDKLESSAGYCNDRTAFSDQAGTTSLSTIPPYATSSATMYFGSYTRVANKTSASTNRPSLNCPRSTVDLYRYVANGTTSNQLKYPAALITADEAAFAGSGYSSSTTPYHANSFLRSGSNFWLLSPDDRYSGGNAYEFVLNLGGDLYTDNVHNAYGVRPAISLNPGTIAESGSGTATDPWLVNP